MSETFATQTIASPVGPLAVAVGPRGVAAIVFADEEAGLAGYLPAGAVLREDAAATAALVGELRAYFAGTLTAFTVPPDLRGTPFQQSVWRQLCAIPYGGTVSYGELARSIGQPKASRAVGMANNRNKIGILVPCHRVVGQDGKLVGYGGGLDRKRFLLELERRVRLAPRGGTSA